MTITLIAPERSMGIRLAAGELRDALDAIGQPARLLSAIPRGSAALHAHFGNSTRPLLGALARRRGDLVTLHDVIPRDSRVRALLEAPQRHIMQRHHVAVHSRHAAELLNSTGFRGTVHLVPPLLPVASIEPEVVESTRAQWKADDFALTLVSAGEVRRTKGIVELLGAAARHPDVLLVLVGRIVDRELLPLLEEASPNVVHTEARSLSKFCHTMAAADALISLRRSSVGESSGPVVQAHRLRKPVVGLRTGSLPEACGPGDILVDPDAGADALVEAALAAQIEDLPSSAPQIVSGSAVARQMTDIYHAAGLA